MVTTLNTTCSGQPKLTHVLRDLDKTTCRVPENCENSLSQDDFIIEHKNRPTENKKKQNKKYKRYNKHENKHHKKCGGKSLSFTKPFLLPCLFSHIGGKTLGANGVGLRKGSVLAMSSSGVSARTTPTQNGWSRKEIPIRNGFHGRKR